MLYYKGLSYLNNKLLSEKISGCVKRNILWRRSALLIFFIIFSNSFSNLVFGQASAAANPYTFTLPAAATTSAGVYAVDGTLLRTLWTTVSYQAGTYAITWDGKDDNGTQMAAGNYIVKVVSNNVQYAWQGIIGNTSANKTGSTVHKQYAPMSNMVIINGKAYCSSGYSERIPSVFSFLTSAPEQRVGMFDPTSTNNDTDYLCSDGTYLYQGAFDAYNLVNSFVSATKISDNSPVTFPNGTTFNPSVIGTQVSAIGSVSAPNALITGIAVQKAGTYLFVSRAGLNNLYVLNKTSGALVQTISMANVRNLVIDGIDNLWVVYSTNTIEKFSVNSGGTLTTTGIKLSGVTTPGAMGVSPDNSKILVIDYATQQVKSFSNLTGAQDTNGTIGQSGGYSSNSTVLNDKFCLSTAASGNLLSFIAFDPANGSFWVGDPGNHRVQHFASDKSFIETIQFQPALYSVNVDLANSTRVFGDWLEYSVDYSQPLSGSTGWKFTNNWGATIPATYDQFSKFAEVHTFTSGGVSRTFGLIRIANKDLYELVELQSDGVTRFTSKLLTLPVIDELGNLILNFNRYAFTGFDGSNNPVWSSTAEVILNASAFKDADPGQLLKAPSYRGYVTSSNIMVLYNPGLWPQGDTKQPVQDGFHLGAIQKGTSKWLWRTGKGTSISYYGAFPDPSRFDVGNGVNDYAGSYVNVIDKNIIAGYHGEFWKNGQTNKYNHYYDNGLAIGQFGVTTQDGLGQEAPAMMAGNALTPEIVRGASSDELYLYHGDESFHGGIARWKISGLNTIKETDIPIAYPFASLVPLIVPGSDLMVQLPYQSPLQNNTAGWTLSPTANQTGWTVKTNVLVSGTNFDPDVHIDCNSASGTFSVNRDLGTNKGLTSWTVSGQISYDNSDQQGYMKEYMDILDANGKIIARLSNQFTYVDDLGHNKNALSGNKTVLTSGLQDSIATIMNQLQPVTISGINNVVTISYAGYTVTTTVFDPTADITSPKTMRAYFEGGYDPTGRSFDFKDMRFVGSKANQVINFNVITGKKFGDPSFQSIAVATSNLPVTFKVISGPATLTNNTITIMGAGTIVIQAIQPGNDYYNAATPVSQNIIVDGSIIRIDL